MGRPPTISREDIAAALIRVVAEQGLDAVSIRTVAREAGVSIGSVQYHFATKDDLLLGAYERAIDNVVARAALFPDPEEHPATTSARCSASCCRSTRPARPRRAWRSPSPRARSTARG